MPLVVDFLWHLRGSVSLEKSPSDDAVFDGLQRFLTRQHKTLTYVSVDKLAFRDLNWFFGIRSNLLVLLMYERGCFWIERKSGARRLYYELRSLYGFVFVCLVQRCFFALVCEMELDPQRQSGRWHSGGFMG